jgi:peptidoglycan/xylan/chitin deacetylase (PgdA/CDA1 family)
MRIGSLKESWPIDEGANCVPRDWSGWPDQKRFALILIHDVDSAIGYGRCSNLKDLENQMGFRSAFFFVGKDYYVSPTSRQLLVDEGFEVGLHGLHHDGKTFRSRKTFDQRAPQINTLLRDWGAAGISSPSMLRRLDWIMELNVEYDISTFDTDPCQPHSAGVRTIFPFTISNDSRTRSYIEIPCTLPQDHCLFIILKRKDIRIWIEKLDWIAENGGVAVLTTHSDYMKFGEAKQCFEEYPSEYYTNFLEYIKNKYAGQYWNALPRELARFWRKREK